jgi:hypothetical protein
MIRARIAGAPPSPFVYHDHGTMATIGRHAAVAELPRGIRARGTIAWWMWLALHLVQIIGFRNRIMVLVNWAWNYFTYERGARLILGHDTATRAAHSSDDSSDERVERHEERDVRGEQRAPREIGRDGRRSESGDDARDDRDVARNDRGSTRSSD